MINWRESYVCKIDFPLQNQRVLSAGYVKIRRQLIVTCEKRKQMYHFFLS